MLSEELPEEPYLSGGTIDEWPTFSSGAARGGKPADAVHPLLPQHLKHILHEAANVVFVGGVVAAVAVGARGHALLR